MSETLASSPAVTIGEANLRIARLQRLVPPASDAGEDLDRPLDTDINVSTTPDEGSHVQLLVKGTVVSWCWVHDFQQQIGDSLLRMGGIAGVGTHQDHRFQGYARRMLHNTLRWMRQEGYDVSMLYGVPGLYPKFGYAVAFPGVVHTLAVRDAERCPHTDGCQVVDYGPEYRDAVLTMYQAYNAGRTGIIRRDPARWMTFRKGLHWGNPVLGKVILTRQGRPVGYFARDAYAEAEILEVGFAKSEYYGDLIHAASAIAWSQRTELLHFHLPEDDVLMRHCRALGVRTEVSYRVDGGGMVRLLNILTTLQKISPLLVARARGHGSLTLRTNLDTVTLSWGGAQMQVTAGEGGQVITLPQRALAQLLYGYQTVDTLAQVGLISGPRGSLAALDRLFPPQSHYHYVTEYF